jgi:hypothetical protein
MLLLIIFKCQHCHQFAISIHPGKRIEGEEDRRGRGSKGKRIECDWLYKPSKKKEVESVSEASRRLDVPYSTLVFRLGRSAAHRRYVPVDIPELTAHRRYVPAITPELTATEEELLSQWKASEDKRG